MALLGEAEKGTVGKMLAGKEAEVNGRCRMVFHCTKTLLDKLEKANVEICPVEDCEDVSGGLFSWYCHLITVDRCKAVVFLNQLTRYAVVLYRPKADDFERLGELFLEGLRVALAREGFTKEIIEAYVERCGQGQFTKNARKESIGHLNSACREVKKFSVLLDADKVIQEKIGLYANYYFAARGDGEYEENRRLPRTFMGWALCEMIGQPKEYLPEIYGHEMYQLKVQIVLDNEEVWRRIVIPSRATFYDLHKAIQSTFDWNGYHCHEFSLLEHKEDYDEDKLWFARRKMIICDGLNPEAEEYLDASLYEIRKDKETVLFDIFEKESQCLYTYDFGADIKHLITLEKVIERDQDKWIKLVDRKGKRPPEDGCEDLKEREKPIGEINLSMRLYGWY